MFLKKTSIKKFRERAIKQATKAALLSKPIITPTLWVLSVLFVATSNFLLYAITHTTEPRFQWFFNFVFFLIVVFTAIGGYIRESIAKWLFTDLEKKLRTRMINIYMSKYELTKGHAYTTASQNIDNFTLESILDFIEEQEK